MSPENLVADVKRVPEWALGTDAIEASGYGYECYRLVRMPKRTLVGWMYDNGAGYRFAQGKFGEPEPLDQEC